MPLRHPGVERVFEDGKIHNLQIAASRLDGIVLQPDATFSFWAAVGPPWRSRGFAIGREIRLGCVVPSVGGGLCQMSGLLFLAASRLGFKIVEAHRHSRQLSDVPLAAELDATVFWNYVDLRFVAPAELRLSVNLDATHLRVALDAKQPRAAASRRSLPTVSQAKVASDCLSCGESACQGHRATQASLRSALPLVLLDEPDAAVSALAHTRFPDGWRAYVPLDGDRRGVDRYRFNLPATAKVRELRLALVHAAIVDRLARLGGSSVAERSVARSRQLAAWYARALRGTSSPLVVSQRLLPHLWLAGALQGLRFIVWLKHLPLDRMNRELDAAARLHQDAPSLREYRAPAEIVLAEREAIAAAAELHTAHPWLARLEPKAAFHESASPAAAPVAPLRSRRVLFPGPTAAREGALEVRAVARRLDLEVLVVGPQLEGARFWEGVATTRVEPAHIPWSEVAAVVHPTIFEARPQLHQRARSHGIPVIATAGAGLPPGAYRQVAFGDALGLEQELRAVLAT